MAGYKKSLLRKPYGWLCLAALLLCACAPVSDHCSNFNALDRSTQFCFEGQAVNKCGGSVYDPPTQVCVSNVIHKRCGDGTYALPGTLCGGGDTPTAYTLTTNVFPAGGGSVTRNPAGQSYDPNTTVTVTATPAAGYQFDKWDGSTSTTATATVTMDGNKALTANFRQVAYTITTNVTPAAGGAVSLEPYLSSYSSGTTVTATAKPNQGYTFTGWEGASTSTTVTASITMDGNKTLTAKFQWQGGGTDTTVTQTYTLTTDITPAGSGTVSRNPGQASYTAGTQVTVTATPGAGYRFVGWEGASTSTSTGVSITMDGNKTLTAKFELITHTLATSVTPTGGGTVTRNPSLERYTDKATVTVTASPSAGYKFVNWAGASTSTEPSVTVTMDGNKTLTANFELLTYTITTDMVPAGGGTVTRSPNQASYNAGTQVTLTATPGEGNAFKNWTGTLPPSVNASSPSITFNISGNMALTANFQQQTVTPTTYTLTTSVSPTGGGTVSRDPNLTNYNAGTSVIVTATAAAGYTFTGWEGASTSTSSPVTVTMDGNKTLTAKFQQQQVTTYTLMLTASPSNCASGFTGAGVYNANATASISVSAASGCTFTGWTPTAGVTSASSASTTVSMTQNRTLTANFQQQATTYALSTSVLPAGGGTVSLSPSGGSYAAGTSVTATANPAEGYEFVNWTGVSTSTSSSATIAMPANNATLTANFRQKIADGTDGGTLTDPRGGSYRTVIMAGKRWMAENLNYATTSGNWCYYNSPDSCAKYGRLYTWDAAMSACPTEWRLPTRTEWNDLIQAAGGKDIAGSKLKSSTGWNASSGISSTDVFGFSALPGGNHNTQIIGNVGTDGYWWGSTEYSTSNAYYWSMNYVSNGLHEAQGTKNVGLSVRCLKDDVR